MGRNMGCNVDGKEVDVLKMDEERVGNDRMGFALWGCSTRQTRRH